MILRRLVRLAILVGLSRRTCQRLQYFRTRNPRRACLAYQPIQPIHPTKDSKYTHHRKPITSSQSRESRRRRSRPLWYSRPSRPVRSSHHSMRIPSPHPDVIRVISILAIIVRIPTAIRRGATCRYAASVILVALLVLTISVSLFRLRIPSIL